MKKIIALLFVLILIGCSNDDSINDVNPGEQKPEIQENVVAILSENSQLISSETDLANGIYSIVFSENPPEIVANDILVGDEGEGFLRKVTSVSANGNTLTMQTTQANMEDVFKIATIEFTTDISESSRMNNGKSQELEVNYLAKGVRLSGNGLEYDFSNTVLYQEGPLTFKITNGTATFNPNFSFKSDYSFPGGLSYLDFKANNANLTIDCDISLIASAGVSLPEFSTTLADFDKNIIFLVLGIPVKVVINTKLVAELNANIDSNFDITTGFTNNYTVTTGVKYENDNWTGTFDLNSNLTPKPIYMGGEVNISQNLTITPRVSVKFYGVIGPYCQPEMTEDFAYNIASPSLDWDSKLKVGLDITTGVDIVIFGHTVADYSTTDNFEETIWNAPENIEIVSGNNQTGTLGEQLPEPIKVKITDKLDNPLSNVPVYFNVTHGGGTVDPASVITDENGFAEVQWTLGNEEGNQNVKATVKKANGSDISSSAIFDIASNTHDIMTIRVTNLLGECDICDAPAISMNPDGTGNVVLGFGSSLDFEVNIGNPILYLWTCNPSCIWEAYSTPVIVGNSINTDELNPFHRKLRFTRIH